MEWLSSIGIVGGIILVLVAIFVLSGFRIVNQYERGVIFVLGRLRGAKGPGLFWVPPFITQMRKIDLRIITIELPPQEGVTRDNVTVKVSAVVYFYVVNPNDAVNNVLDYYRATVQIAQTTLRNVLGQSNWTSCSPSASASTAPPDDHRRAHRAAGASRSRFVEVKDVELPQTMQRAMAQQAEAEREKRAESILAAGRVRGRADAGRRRRTHLQGASHVAVALPADADRDRRGQEHDHRLPAATLL